MEELKELRYVGQIVVSLGRANRNEFNHAREFFSVLPQQTIIIWNDGERVNALRKVLEGNDLEIGPDGKGRSEWTAYGSVLSAHKAELIALHDCDIVQYSRKLLARLVYPAVNPNLGFELQEPVSNVTTRTPPLTACPMSGTSKKAAARHRKGHPQDR